MNCFIAKESDKPERSRFNINKVVCDSNQPGNIEIGDISE
jgi:hypothetical protein